MKPPSRRASRDRTTDSATGKLSGQLACELMSSTTDSSSWQLVVFVRHSRLWCATAPQTRKDASSSRGSAAQNRTSRDQPFRPGRPLKSAAANGTGEDCEQPDQLPASAPQRSADQPEEQHDVSGPVPEDRAHSHPLPEEEGAAHSTDEYGDIGPKRDQFLDLASLALPKLGSLRPIRTSSVAQEGGPDGLHSQTSNLTYGLEPGSAGRGRTARPRADSSTESASPAGTPRHRSRRNSLAAANSEGPWGDLLSGPVSRLSRGISILHSQAGDETPTRGGRSMSPKLRGVFAEFAVKVLLQPS